jgi:RNA polymerase sigma-70 factor (ECF subfamily)
VRVAASSRSDPRNPTSVDRARSGDPAAYAELIREHEQVAFRLAWLLCGSPQDGEDALQEAALKAWSALPGFRPGAPFRPWFLTIVANEARSRRRSGARRHDLELRFAAEHRRGSAEPLEHESRSMLLQALRGLPRRDREVVFLRHMLDLSVGETAAVMGCREGTVKSRRARALEKLRSAMGEGSP